MNSCWPIGTVIAGPVFGPNSKYVVCIVLSLPINSDAHFRGRPLYEKAMSVLYGEEDTFDSRQNLECRGFFSITLEDLAKLRLNGQISGALYEKALQLFNESR